MEETGGEVGRRGGEAIPLFRVPSAHPGAGPPSCALRPAGPAGPLQVTRPGLAGWTPQDQHGELRTAV